MLRQNKFKIKEDLKELESLLKKQTSLSGEKRVKCLIFTKENRFSTRSQLAQYLGGHKCTIERWLNKYDSNGVDFMVQNQSKPKESQYITDEIHNGLASRVTNSSNPFLGYWDAQQWVTRIWSRYKLPYFALSFNQTFWAEAKISKKIPC